MEDYAFIFAGIVFLTFPIAIALFCIAVDYKLFTSEQKQKLKDKERNGT